MKSVESHSLTLGVKQMIRMYEHSTILGAQLVGDDPTLFVLGDDYDSGKDYFFMTITTNAEIPSVDGNLKYIGTIVSERPSVEFHVFQVTEKEF